MENRTLNNFWVYLSQITLLPEDKMNTEEKIIKETISLIDHQGYQSLSLRKLTNSLGLTTGAFYKRFSSKEVLFQRTAQQLSQEFVDSLTFDSKDSPESQLLQIADKLCTEFKNNPKRMDFLFFNSVIKHVYTEKDNHQFQLLNKVNELIKKLNSGDNQNTLFIQIWSFIQGYVYLINNNITQYDDILVKHTLHQLLGDK